MIMNVWFAVCDEKRRVRYMKMLRQVVDCHLHGLNVSKQTKC